MADENPTTPGPPFWPLRGELNTLHNSVIDYSCRVQEQAVALQNANPHLSYEALAAIHTRAVLIHRSTRDLCENGWTPVSSILIRTLADLYANAIAILFNEKDREYMAFRYMLAFPLSRVNDTSLTKEVRARHEAEITEIISHLPETDRDRARPYRHIASGATMHRRARRGRGSKLLIFRSAWRICEST